MKSGAGTKIHSYCNIYDDVVIGNNCTIASYVEIGRNVRIGDFCSIQAFTFIPEGVSIGNNVFVGPRVCFTNCRYPSANYKYYTNSRETYINPETGMIRPFFLEKTVVEDAVVIGAGSIILCGITIGKEAVIGAGSLVLKDVPDNTKIIQRRINGSEIPRCLRQSEEI